MKLIPFRLLFLCLGIGIFVFAAAFVGGLYFSGALFQKPAIAAAAATSRSPAPPNAERLTQLARELDTWNKELLARKQQLLELDQSLQHRESLIKVERETLEQERQKLTNLQKQLESRFIFIKKDESENLEQLADLYNKIKPEDASRLMRQFPDDQATRLLTLMKPVRSARLLEAWIAQFPDDRERLARIMDHMRVVSRNVEALTDSAPPP